MVSEELVEEEAQPLLVETVAMCTSTHPLATLLFP